MGNRNSHGKCENKCQEDSMQHIKLDIYNLFIDSKSKFSSDESLKNLIDNFVVNKILNQGHYLNHIKRLIATLIKNPSYLPKDTGNYCVDTTDYSLEDQVFIMSENSYSKFTIGKFKRILNGNYIVEIDGAEKFVKWKYIYNNNDYLSIIYKLVDNMIKLTKNYIINKSNKFDKNQYHVKLSKINSNYNSFGCNPNYKDCTYNDLIDHVQDDVITIETLCNQEIKKHESRKNRWWSVGEGKMINRYNIFMRNTISPYKIEVDNTLDKYSDRLLVNLNIIKDNVNQIINELLTDQLSRKEKSTKLKEISTQIGNTIKEIVSDYPDIKYIS